ncbi:IclR family transcriptional regulator [Marinomonas sp. 15G1-11]|mgnify:CR=1 FL=1|uniref:IclR family transcriptional regulator n=1 Tax=Marinomonas phaeophyticola TaxID=3004091 RepID=A0ABT4JRY7_9GAMM|nr:IclR family transcriptional regulator [Marinomonas sp. 15G1-11]MCZ2721036.1 IclR family transcriptional regulator [Marinomonas sp. 15G1-11]
MSEQIKSLLKSLSVLEFLGKYPNGASLQHISQETGMTKSSAHRILSTYESAGYVTQLSSGRDYRLTMKLLHVGQSAINSDVTGMLKPYLTHLLETINETINFLAFDGDSIIFKDKLEPSNASFRTRTYVGLHSPAYCSAAGKCFLAFASDEVREAYWQRNTHIMKPLTENTILEKDAFFDVLDQVKERGFAIDDEENEAGISCVAIPVFNKDKMPIYAISVSSLSPKMARLGFSELAARLRETAIQIEHKLF